jgi:AraC-like DNA-binding protein
MKNPKPLIDRLSKKLLDDLQKRKITNAQAAEKLGVSESYLSRTVAALQTKVPGETVQQRKANADLTRTRRQFRTKLAKEVIRGRKTVQAAATEAGCSVRTMFRYVERYRQ